VPLPETPEEYVHPYTYWPWYQRTWFLCRRALFLLWLWTPCLSKVAWTVVRGKLSDVEWLDWLLEVMVETMEQSGAGFQKFCQWAAMRPDLFPQRVCRALAKLQDNAPLHSLDDTKAIIRRDLGLELDDIFEQFDETPVASGTVGQVYKAKLRPEYALPDGRTQVAVKVRHPNVLDSSYADIWFIFWMIRASPSLVGITLALPFKEEEFYNNIQKQVDFTWEAYNLIKFRNNFRSEANGGGRLSIEKDTDGSSSDISSRNKKLRVVFPCVHTGLLSESVLVESWGPGENLSSMLRVKASRSKVWDSHLSEEIAYDESTRLELSAEERELRKELASRCCDIACKMFLRDNYIHGDLHAGNLIYSAKHNLLTVIDAGLTTYLDESSFVPFGDFLRALCVGDANVIVEKLVEFNVNDNFTKTSVPAFTQEVSSILDKYMGVDRSRQEDQLIMGYIMGEVLNTIGKYKITLKGDISASLMTISISEGLILSLDPTFDLVGRCLPYFVRYAGWETLSSIRQAGYFSSSEKARDMISQGVE